MGKSPSELLMNRQVRTKFSALRHSKNHQNVKIFRENLGNTPGYEIGDAVFAKNYGRGANWLPGKIIEDLSPKSYLIQVRDVTWKRHSDQLRKREVTYSGEELKKDTNLTMQNPDMSVRNDKTRAIFRKEACIQTSNLSLADTAIQINNEVSDNTSTANSTISDGFQQKSNRIRNPPKRYVDKY